MNGNRDFRDLLRAFNDEGIRYLVVGGYAVIHYTEPRFTKDLDVWVRPDRRNAEKVYRALSRFGAPLRGVTVEDFMNPVVVFQVGVEPNRIDVTMGITGVDFEAAWPRRTRGNYEDQRVPVLGKDDLIRNKRRLKRPQDLIDLEALRAARPARKGRRRGRRR